MFKNVNILLRTLALGGLVGVVGWWTVFLRGEIEGHQKQLEVRDREIATLASNLEASEEEILELGEEITQQQEEIRALELSLMLLKVDHRVARVQVLEQTEEVDEAGEATTRTRVRFVELGPDGLPLDEGLETTIDGARLYVESLVIKFDDTYVEQGDFLRGSSVVLFKGLFGEDQKPSDGTPIDSEGGRPSVYGSEDGGDPLHAELWEQFWTYANDPEAAREKGVRAMQGEAPFMELRPGGSYRVELRASDGLTIKAE